MEHGSAECCCSCAYRVSLGVRRESSYSLSAGGSEGVCADVGVSAQCPGSRLPFQCAHAATHLAVAHRACVCVDEFAALGLAWIAVMADCQSVRRMDRRCGRNVVVACTASLQCRCLIASR